MGRHSLLQGIFLIQGLNPSLLHCREFLYHLSPSEWMVNIYWALIMPGTSRHNLIPSSPQRLRKELFLSQFCMGGNWSIMRLSKFVLLNLPKVTQSYMVKLGFEPWSVQALALLSWALQCYFHKTLPLATESLQQMEQLSWSSGNTSLHIYLFLVLWVSWESELN